MRAAAARSGGWAALVCGPKRALWSAGTSASDTPSRRPKCACSDATSASRCATTCSCSLSAAWTLCSSRSWDCTLVWLKPYSHCQHNQTTAQGRAAVQHQADKSP